MREQNISTASSSEMTTESLSKMLMDVVCYEGSYSDLDECVKDIQTELKNVEDNSQLISFCVYNHEQDYEIGIVMVYSYGCKINALFIGKMVSKRLALDIIRNLI